MLYVTAFLNGDHESQGNKMSLDGVKTMPELFHTATVTLNLVGINITLTRVFDQRGTEITAVDQILPDAIIYFSAGEDFVPKEGAETDGTTPAEDQSSHYLYNAAVFTAGLVSTSYGYFSHAVRTHASPSVVATLNNVETTVSSYSKPLVEYSLPYFATALGWSDQQLDAGLKKLNQQTQQLLATETGQTLTQKALDVKLYTQHALDSFINANNNTTGADGEQTQEQQDAHKASYVENLKSKLGTAWNDSLLPWANSMYQNIQQYAPRDTEGTANNNNKDEQTDA